MKRLRKSLLAVVAFIAISATLAAKGGIIKNTVINNTQDCYFNPPSAVVGTCVIPAGLMNTDDCTAPPLAYCCYTVSLCFSDPSKALVSEIILYRGA